MNDILTVMTFNIRGAGQEEDGINSWHQRSKLNLEIINEASPDIFGLQETQYGNLASYHGNLHGYEHYLGMNMDYGNFNPIFWKKDRLQLVDAGEFWLNSTQARDRPAIEWGANTIRSTTWVILEDIHAHKRICHINTHLDNLSEQARVNGSKLILNSSYTFAKHLPILLTGDFNSGSWTPPGLGFKVPYTDNALNLFKKADFVDIYGLFNVDGPYSNTFHNFEGERYEPAYSHGLWRVDWILARYLSGISCNIIRDAKPPLFPSDHYPVVATVAYE